MLMTFLSPVTKSDSKTEVKLYFPWLLVFPHTSVGRLGDWHWWEDQVCRFETRCLHIYFYNVYVVSTQILIKLCTCYSIQLYVSKPMFETHTQSNWKWIPKYADCNNKNWICNCCLSVKHMKSSTFSLMSNK
jgi:hypothetical protein